MNFTTRKKRGKLMIKYFVTLIILAVLVYIFLAAKSWKLEINTYTIENEKIPKDFDDFTIVQISDLHNKSFGKENAKLLNSIYDINPDAVFITGDLIEGEDDNYKVALNFMNELVKKYKVYYIIGNHEQKSLIKKYKELYKIYFDELYKMEFINLDNESIKIKNKDSAINLYGLTVPYSCYRYFFSNKNNTDIDKNFLENNLGTPDKSEYNILLAHTPFYFEEYEKWGADLILSGHVHGGIIRIPFVGGLLSPNRTFLPKYDWGKYIKNKSTMIVSKGLGNSKVLIRVNCNPEIVKIILKCK